MSISYSDKKNPTAFDRGIYLKLVDGIEPPTY